MSIHKPYRESGQLRRPHAGCNAPGHPKANHPHLDERSSLHTPHTPIRRGRSRPVYGISIAPSLLSTQPFTPFFPSVPSYRVSLFSFHFFGCCTYLCERYEAVFAARTVSVTPFRSNFLRSLSNPHPCPMERRLR